MPTLHCCKSWPPLAPWARLPGLRGSWRSPGRCEARPCATGAASRAPWEDELWRLCSDAHIARARDALAHGDTAACAAATATAETAARKACGLEPRRAVNVQRLGDAVVMRARMARARQGA